MLNKDLLLVKRFSLFEFLCTIFSTSIDSAVNISVSLINILFIQFNAFWGGGGEGWGQVGAEGQAEIIFVKRSWYRLSRLGGNRLLISGVWVRVLSPDQPFPYLIDFKPGNCLLIKVCG